MDVITRLKDLIDKYDLHKDQYLDAKYNETEVRVDFVNPFFELLGWDVNNNRGLPSHLREVTHEADVLVDEDGKEKNKKPDYLFKIGTEVQYFLETKKPSVDITRDSNPAFQLRRYGWNGNLKISVLTNFNDLYIYDCTVRPIETDSVMTALIAHYNYSEYVDKFDDIKSLLSKESVISGEFDQKFDHLSQPLKREPFNSFFLKQIRQWRSMIAESIVRNNEIDDNQTLNLAVQRILDRILFLRFCEDRNFEEYETLKQATTYDKLKTLFLEADHKYDSGLFRILEEDNYKVSDEVLHHIFCDLYYPNSSYAFSVVDPYIIGQIYELYLGEEIVVNDDRTTRIEKKPEVVDSQGAVNTPKNITDIIIKETLGPLLNKLTANDIYEFKVADICCGAGNFLLSAFEFMSNVLVEKLELEDKDTAISTGKLVAEKTPEIYRLSYGQKRKLLKASIYGVDIDPMAVEVTKFSLLIKLLEDTDINELKAFEKNSHETILPDLTNNIKCGNSLVDSSYGKYNPEVFSDVNTLLKIRMFDWEREFPAITFNAIVGNPPYIRIQNMVRYSKEEYDFYKSSFSDLHTAKKYSVDKYQLFVERAIKLVGNNGSVGYIIPHKFMNTRTGETLRTILAKNHYVSKIIYFGENQAFRGKSTYTCILILNKSENEKFEFDKVDNLLKYYSQNESLKQEYSARNISSAAWNIRGSANSYTISDNKKYIELSKIADIFVGVQTSADKIFIIKPTSVDDNYVGFVGNNGKPYKIERGILRPSLYDAQLYLYQKTDANTYIIFPYVNNNGRAGLIDIDTMKEKFPHCYYYLKDFKKELDGRNRPNKTADNWYAYGRTQSIRRFLGDEHLIWPVLSLSSNYVYDNDSIVFTGGGNGPYYGLAMKKDSKYSIFYIQALLNSPALENQVKNVASTFRGGYYSHSKQYLNNLPIRVIDFDSPGDKKCYDEIVSNVHKLMILQEKIVKASNHAVMDAMQKTMQILIDEQNKKISLLYDTHGGI